MSPTVLPRPAQRAWWPREEIRSSIIFRSAALVAVAFLAASSLLLIQAWKDQREVVRQAMASAVATANVLDREVMATSYLLKGLSSSPALRSGDLAGFYDQLKSTSLPDGASIILWDLQGQLINTRRAFGAKLPRVTDFAGHEASLDRIREKGVSVSDRALGPVAQTYIIVVSLRTNGPDGQMTGFLSASITEQRLSALINEQRLPPGWTSSLLDRNGRHVATSGADRLVFDETLSPRLAEHLRVGQREGQFINGAGKGAQTFTASHLSDTSGFTALTQVPTSLLNEPVYAALRQIGLGAIALLLMGGIAGSALARRVGRPIEALATSAAKTKDQLNFAEARHASFWTHTPESFFTVAVTPDSRFVFEGINPAHERLTGLLSSQIVGKEPHECLTSEVADAVTARYRECVRRGEAISYSERLDLPGGVRFWRTSLAPVRDPATARVVLLFGSARDVTEDLEARAELARLNERLQSILSSVSDCYCTFDREFRITAINAAALEWLGLAEESAVGTSLKEEFSGDHECMRGTRAAMIAHRAYHAEVASAFRPGRWLDYHVYPSPEGVSVFFRDITEAKSAREEVNALSQRLLALQEEERQRIASELHDSTSQHLIAISLNLMRLGAVSGEAASRIIAEINGSLDEALKELRVFTYLLHPPSLESEGLRLTLRSFVEGFGRRTGLEMALRTSPDIEGLPLDLQRSALRVVQEALLNAHKHASATRVSIHAKVTRGALVLRVYDNGRGIAGLVTNGSTPGEGIQLGVGIPGMRARLRQFGGDLVIRTKRRGTTVLAALPVTVPGLSKHEVTVVADETEQLELV